MVAINILNREGATLTLEVSEGQSLMEALRNADLDVLGTCGGMCSCGSCHIYAGDALMAATAAPREDEQDMLDALSDVVEVRPNSRLACQIPVSRSLQDVDLEIAPQI
jgi:2Fe-2S ferredoxin